MTTPPSADTLAPCPFCGEQLQVRPLSAGGVVTRHWSHANPMGDCWAASLMIDEGDAEDIAAWNARIFPPQPISTAPRNATELVLFVPAKRNAYYTHRRIIGHWAEDLSGEEQPPFRGWFYANGDYGFAQISPDPEFWQPLFAIPSGSSIKTTR